MEIKIGHYVTSKLGEIYNVDRFNTYGELILTNIATNKIVVWGKEKVKPLWLQAGDEVSISYANGSIRRFTMDVILYNEIMNDYEYVLYDNEIPNELLNSREIVVYIDKFEP